MNFSKETTDALSKPLDPKHVTKPTGKFGPKGDYLEGWYVINEANRIFGFDGWSYTHSLQKVHEGKNEKGNIEIGYICKCTVTIGDITREDIGYGSGYAKIAGDAHEGAVKEAVTDALKRALRTFGNQFGLALYDKTQANVRVEEPPAKSPINDEQIAWLTNHAEASVGIEELCKHFEKKDIKDFTFGELTPARDWLKSPTEQKEKQNA